MATFPPSIAPQPAPGAPGVTAMAARLAMLSQAVQMLATQIPDGAPEITQIMSALRTLQGKAMSTVAPTQPAAPPQ